MNPLFTVPTDVWGSSYGFFYMTALLVGSLVALYEGYRRKWPLVPWLIVLAWCATWGVVGSKLLVISWGEWNAALSHGHIPFTAEKSFLGGVLGAIIGVFFARRLLGLRDSVADAFAFVLPISLAIGRIGCLLGGCCFGKPTMLPWAIAYSKNSCAYDLHLSRGLIGHEAPTSLPVHPTQLYEIIFSLVIAAILWNCRKLMKRPGSLFFLYLVLYGGFRFLEEFVREGGSVVFGLKAVQWGLLLVVLSVSVLLTWRERASSIPSKVSVSPQDIFQKNMIAIGIVSIILFIGKGWFTPLELATLIIITLPAFTGIMIQLVRRFAKRLIPWATITALAISVVFICSSFDTDNPADETKTSYYSVSFAGMTGKYEETCGPVHSYSVAGVGISRTDRSGQFDRLEYGVRGYIGNDTNGGSYRIRGINPYVQRDFREIGLGFGINLGGLYLDGEDYSLFPQAGLRIGRLDKFFIEGKFADHFPGPFPAPIIKLGIGFGLKNEGSLRLGISDAGWYVQPDLPISNNWIISPFLAAGSENFFQFGLTLRHKSRSR
jgi:prolipoprotein diacylglyceryltransferase